MQVQMHIKEQTQSVIPITVQLPAVAQGESIAFWVLCNRVSPFGYVNVGPIFERARTKK
jgi:hypothetical protein